ncbi:MAG TPA: glycosyltransferase family 39 protein [Phycisphaerae bacterium]|nr:glycosyltransferase family 39 protein [Phycisphaerae bacterium]
MTTPQEQPPIGRPPGASANGYRLATAALMFLAAFACLGLLGSGPRLGDHESINALGARQTLESGDWLVPQVGEVTRVRKPPLGIWSIAAASELVNGSADQPVTELSARLPSAVAGGLNVLAIWWLGTMLFGRRTGLVAGFIAAGCVGTIFFARNAQVDMTMALFTTLCYACFWRGAMHERPSRVFMILFYVALACAMMAKAPLPLVTVGFALAAYWFVTIPLVVSRDKGGRDRLILRAMDEIWPQVRQLGRLWLIPGVVLFVILAGAWPYYIYKNVDNVLPLWRLEYLSRYGGDLSKKSEPFYYYIPIAFGLAVPFMLSLPEAVAATFLSRYRTQRAGLAFALTWAIVGTAFLSTASYKRPHYLLSMMPAYCLLLAPVLDRLFLGVLAATPRTVKLACAAVPIGLGAALLIGAQVAAHQFPALQTTFIVAGACLWFLWTLAAVLFALGARVKAFAMLLSWVLVVVLVVWPALGRHITGEPQLNALVKGFEDHGIGTDARIYWVEGRPDSSIEFYTGYRLRRLIDELEMATLRTNRAEVGVDLLQEIARRIEQKLTEPEPAYLVMSVGNFELMQRETTIQARKVFELSGFKEYPGEELAVISQPAPASAPTTRAEH